MGRGTGLVGEEDQEEEVQDAGKDETKRSSSTRPGKAGRAVLPAQDGELPHRAIPGVDEEHGHGGMRVVPTQDTDSGASAQALQKMEDAAEDTVGGSSKGNGKRRELLHGPGPAGG